MPFFYSGASTAFCKYENAVYAVIILKGKKGWILFILELVIFQELIKKNLSSLIST